MSLGRSIEDVVENLCHQSFFADFTIRSPKYYKGGDLEKEAADLLIVFGETLLAIQIKSKTINSLSIEMEQVEVNRVKKSIEKAVHQFHALAEALDNPQFTSFVNGRGVEVAFDRSSIKNFVFMVIFVPVWSEASKPWPRIHFDVSCYPDGAIPVHLFSLEQFSFLLTQLDTLPDFLIFLTARWVLHGEKLISRDGDPLDEWALITFEPKRLLEIIDAKTFTDISGMRNRHRTSIERLERQEKPSYFIDRLIENLNAVIGRKMPIDPRFNLLSEPNSLKSYLMTIPYLAKLNRKERSQLVEFLINRVMDCKKQTIAFRGFKFSEQSEEAYCVLAARANRPERRIALTNVARGMAFKFKAKTVIGLAVGDDWPNAPACDVAVIDTSRMKISKRLAEMAHHAFGKIRKANE